MDGHGTSWAAGARGLGLAALAACLLVSSCAVPVAPTGGPADDTPPRLVSSSPADGSTEFTGRTVELTFSEHVDRQSFPGAVSIQPDPDGRLEIDWNGRTARIRLPSDLRSETTYILTIDNSLRDVHNVRLDRPITLAFATGSTINRGRLSGRIVQALDGAPAARVDVWAFADSDSALFSGSPLYRTQTAGDGSFSFSWLRETDYFVVGVRDANGNRRLDSNESVALGARRLVAADTLAADSTSIAVPWVLRRYDSTPPVPERVASTGRRHVIVRFSEPVMLLDRAAPDVSLTRPPNDSVSIVSTYATGPGVQRSVGLFTDLLATGSYTLSGRFPVADSAGNRADAVRLSFEVADTPDAASPGVASFLPDSSAGVRFRAIVGNGDAAATGAVAAGAATDDAATRVTLWPGDSAGVRFDVPAPKAMANGLLSARDTTGADLSDRLRASSPVVWTFDDTSVQGPFELVATASAAQADSAVAIEFERAGMSRTGELSGLVHVHGGSGNVGAGRVVIQAFRAAPGAAGPLSPLRTVSTTDGSFIIRGLPHGVRVTLRAFIDADGDGTWDAGRPVPFEAPEPVAWLTADEPVRARWETALSDTLFLRLHD